MKIHEINLNTKPFRAFRIGNISTRAHQLKITLSNTKDVFDILCAQSKLRSSTEFKDVWIISDQTMN